MQRSYTLVGVGIVALFAAFYSSLGWFGAFGSLDAPWQMYCETPQLYPWNHLDLINQVEGQTSDADPILVFQQHVNALKGLGL